MATATGPAFDLVEKSGMKKAAGYTLLELMLSVSLICILTGISLIGIVSPQRMMEKQTQKNQVEQVLNKAQLRVWLTGQDTQLSFTPWALWLNEQKVMEFPQGGPWQWQTDIDKVRLSPNGELAVTLNSGKTSVSPQTAILKYNQTMMVQVEINPALHFLGVTSSAR